jgi:hypothetical protein
MGSYRKILEDLNLEIYFAELLVNIQLLCIYT